MIEHMPALLEAIDKETLKITMQDVSCEVTRDTVTALLPYLERWVKTGSLTEDDKLVKIEDGEWLGIKTRSN